jgi:hypothetical protein
MKIIEMKIIEMKNGGFKKNRIWPKEIGNSLEKTRAGASPTTSVFLTSTAALCVLG